MVVGVQVLVPQERSHLPALARHVAGLQAAGHPVVFVTADRPSHVVRRVFEEASVDGGRVHCIDVITGLSGTQEAAENTTYLASPTMLEMIAIRIEQALCRMGPGSRVVLDSLNTLALYNGVEPMQEFTHFLANRLHLLGSGADLVVRDNADGAVILGRIECFLDGRQELN